VRREQANMRSQGQAPRAFIISSSFLLKPMSLAHGLAKRIGEYQIEPITMEATAARRTAR